MLNVLFLLLNLLICIYFISKKNSAVLGYLIFFQEIHLIPFDNLGMSSVGYLYYIAIAASFLVYTTDLKLSPKRVRFIVNDPVTLSIILLSVIILLHVLVIGLQSDAQYTLTVRYFLQVFPAAVFIILAMEKRVSLYQLAYGIVIYGVLLVFILLLTTDILSMTSLARGRFRDEVGISPLAISRMGGIMFIAALFLLKDKFHKTYTYLLVCVLILSVIILIMGLSRGPLIALILSLLLYYIISKGDYVKKTVTLLLVSTFLAGVFIFFYNYFDSELLTIFVERIESLQNYENMRRYDRYITTLEFLRNDFNVISYYFFIGLGPAGFAHYFGMGHAHNIIVEYVIEYGLFGLISLFLFTFFSFYYSFKIIRSDIPKVYVYIPVIFVFMYIAGLFSGDLIARRNLLFISLIQVMLVYYYYPIIYQNQRLLFQNISKKNE